MALDDHHKHFVGNVAQKAFIEQDGKILLVRYPRGSRAGEIWDMPGGRLHEGESAVEGLQREVREEIGAEITIESILATGTFSFADSSNKKGATLYFVVYRSSLLDPKQQLVPEPEEIAEIRWFPIADFFTLNILHKEEYIQALKPFLV